MKKWIGTLAALTLGVCLGTATFAATSFKDVRGTKYEDSVQNLVEIGLVDGYPEDNTYRPNVPVTRAQIAKLMVVSLGEEGKVAEAAKKNNTFKDMKSNHWAYGYINVAKELGIINGYLDGSFKPDETVNYAEATTMAIRALGYEDEVAKSKENWPNNYVSYAKKLKLYDNLGTIIADKQAARGDTAIILWNMLRTGVCTVVSQTGTTLNYGQGQKMINKYKNYIYMDDALITSVDFADDYSDAKVTITGDEKLTVTLTAEQVLDFYGRKLNVLYNTKNKKVVSLEDTKAYKVIEGDVEKVTSKKITIDDDEYTLPAKANILLYRVDSVTDAIQATIIREGTTVKYVIASGAKNVYPGLVVENEVTVNKEDGIRLKKVGSSTKTSYALIDEDDMPEEGSVILYYTNKDGKLGIVKEFKVEDADEIADATKTKIKVGKNSYTYDKDTFTVVEATSSAIKNLDFTDIDEEEDMVSVYEYAGETYVIIFPDAVEDEDKKDDAWDDLQTYMTKTAKSYLDREAKYSQTTYLEFIEAYDVANGLVKKSTTTVKINSALSKLKTAISELRSVTSSTDDGKIAAKRDSLRKLVADCDKNVVPNKAKYTTSSYNTLSTALTYAKNILKAESTLTKATNAYNDLKDAKDDLKLIQNTAEHQAAVTALNTALARVSEVKAQSDYTTASWATYQTAKTNADKIKLNVDAKTATEITSAASALDSAITGLELAQENLTNQLNDLIVSCTKEVKDEDEYMPDTYEAYELAYDFAMANSDSTVINTLKKAIKDLEDAKDALKTKTEVLTDLKSKVNSMSTASNVATALAMSEDDKLAKIDAIEDAVKDDLEALIESVDSTDIPTNKLEALVSARKVFENSNSTITALVKAYTDLSSALNA